MMSMISNGLVENSLNIRGGQLFRFLISKEEPMVEVKTISFTFFEVFVESWREKYCVGKLTMFCFDYSFQF